MANPLDVKIEGQALNDQGFTVDKAISGVGLNTFGFLWPCADIWSNAFDSVTTGWTACISVSATPSDCLD